MKLSMSVTNFSWRDGPLAARLSDIARIADDGGLHALWVADHLLQADPYGARPGETEMLEAYTTLGFLAARTERVRLGTLVTAVTFRPPALLVKAITTLDVLAGGRALFGIGAGYEADEAAAMGLPLPPVGERFARLEETLRIALQLWAGDTTPFAGAHYRLADPVLSPPPLTRPHPPILIGGTGERRTLPLVARYADACNVFDLPDGGATVRHKLGVLQQLCAEIGRPYDAIEKTISTRLPPGESAASFVERCRTFADLGIDHVGVITTGPWTDDAVATLAAAAPRLSE
jgi:F420-dependent oxidoreductase-like protein